MSTTSTTLSARALDPITVAHSRANCIFLAVCVAAFVGSLYVIGGAVSLFLLLFTIWQALRTFMARTVFYDSRLENRSLFGMTLWADYAKVTAVSSWPAALTISGADNSGKQFSFDIGSLDGDTAAIKNFLASRTPR
jgi:hypothetical protein